MATLLSFDDDLLELEMRSLVIAAIAVSSCAILAAKADDGAERVSGVWYGTYQFESNMFGGRPPAVLHVLDLSVSGEEVTGTLATGSGTDRRTATQRAAGALGLPGNAGPKVPTPRPIAGVVEGTTLILESTSQATPEVAVTAVIGGNRLRADVRTGQVVRAVVFRRCRPSRRGAGDDCSLDALWEQYLRQSGRTPLVPPTAQEVQRITVPSR